MKYVFRFIKFIIVSLYDIFSILRDIPRIYINSRSNYSDAIKELEDKKQIRLALIAPHPTSTLNFTVRNLLLALEKSDFTIFVALARNHSSDWISAEFPNIRIVQRELYGRDFRVWKYIIEDLLKNKTVVNNIDHLLLANDSLYYNNNTDSIIKKFIDSKLNWSCLFESYQGEYHAQSFLLNFRGTVVNSSDFASFWNSYKPFSSRKHSIDKGEMVLSRKIAPSAGRPDCVFSSHKLLNHFRNLKKEDRKRIIDVLRSNNQISSSYDQQIKEIEELWGLTPLRGGSFIEEARERPLEESDHLFRLIARVIELHNPTHTAGLLANSFWGAPIKRDLAARGSYHIADTLRLAVGYSEEELEIMSEDLRMKALPISHRGIKRVLFNAGRI